MTGRARGTTRRIKAAAAAVAVLGVVLLGAGAAVAYWTTTVTSTPAAKAGSMSAPTAFSATAGSNSAVLLWHAPAALTGYTLTQSPGTLAGCSATPSSSTTTCTATGLTAGTQYTWTLTATYDSWSSTSVTAQATPYAADGTGTLTVSPSSVLAGSTGNALTFTYTAATGGMSNGEVDVAVPASWVSDGGSAPQTTSSSGAGYTTASGGGGTVSVSGSTISVTGVTLSGGSTLTITFGSGSGLVTAPSAAGSPYSFAGTEKSLSSGSLTALASSPTVTVNNTNPAVTGLMFSSVTVNGSAKTLSSSNCTGIGTSSVTCTLTGGNNAVTNASVQFVNSAGTATVYSATADETITMTYVGKNNPAPGPATLTISKGTTTSTGSGTTTKNGSAQAKITATFGSFTAVLVIN